jgi:hypothetical protein
MKTLYEKIEIHSESDLPKKSGVYIFGWNKTNSNLRSGVENIKFSTEDDELTSKELVDNYDWYLLPVQESQPKKTAGEILHSKFPNACNYDWYIPIKECMEEYYNQSRQTVSDQEIENEITDAVWMHNLSSPNDKAVIDKQVEIIEKKSSCISHLVKIILRNGSKLSLRSWESNFIKDYAEMYSKLESELKALTSNKE